MTKNDTINKTVTQIEGVKSKQKNDKKKEAWLDGAIENPYAVRWLLKAYENSFSFGGICDIVGRACDTWFVNLIDDDADDETKNIHAFLQTIDLEFLFTSLFVAWNSFFEIVQGDGNATWKLFAFDALTDSIRIKVSKTAEEKEQWDYLYIQRPNNWKVPVPFMLNEMMHFKTLSMTDKYYWYPKGERVISQIYLLVLIDKFYEAMLEKWNMSNKIFTDEEWKMTKEQKQAVEVLLQDTMRWVDSAFKGLILPSKVGMINLMDQLDTQAFLAYRMDLIKSICIAFNFPFDLLLSENANRATSEASMAQLYDNVALPLQRRVIKILKQFLYTHTDRKPENIERIAFNSVDSWNGKEIMEIITWYKKFGVIDANEARHLSPFDLDEREDWYELTTQQSWQNWQQQPWESQLDKIKKSVKALYWQDKFTELQKKHVQRLPQ